MTDYQRIAAAIEYVQTNFQAQPSLELLAEQASWSPFHFQRKFREWAGVSPKKFLQFVSLDYAKALLRQQRTVEESAYETGLSGTGRLHDLFVSLEAMTPGDYRHGGAALSLSYAFGSSSFGEYLAAATAKGICYLAFVDGLGPVAALAALQAEWPQAALHPATAATATPHRQVARFFAREFAAGERLHLHLQGTAFQVKVWAALLRIPEGQLASYGQLAAALGQPGAGRAVGTAIGANPVGYLIPCHRVIQQSGELGGYRWGGPRKAALLGWEAARTAA